MDRNYASGDRLRSSGQIIAEVVEQNTEFGVYITTDKAIRYEFYQEDGKIPKWANPILQQFVRVTTIGLQVFPPGKRDQSRTELALALRTALADKNPKGCPVLQALEDRYCGRYLRTVALWYVSGSSAFYLLAIGFAWLWLGNFTNWPPYAVAASCGGLGALLSVLQKMWGKDMIDRCPMYYCALEGGIRVLLGMICGAIALTLIKGNLIAGVAAGNEYAVASLCVAAGFVERFVPSILIRLANKKK